jgi:CRP/FNR family transcriptional regulator
MSTAATALLEIALRPQRRVLRTGESVFCAGEPFTCLHIVHSGFFKLMHFGAGGRQQLIGLHFKGDWLGFDGIARGDHGCECVAMDTGEVWSVRYDHLLHVCVERPELLMLLHTEMSREMAREREAMLSVCTLSTDARVAHFLRRWVDSLAQRGLRTDSITLKLTRAEIGDYLGMTVESVSRALSRLARARLIEFAHKGRREVGIPDPAALSAFVHASVAPHPTTLLQ